MRLNKYLRQLAVAGSIALVTGTASAQIALTLSGPFLDNSIGPQSDSNPCIIAGTQCTQPDTMGYNEYSPNNASSYDRYSTNDGPNVGVNVPEGVEGTPYTVGQLDALGLTSFIVAIDVNTTGAESEVLELFEVIINGVVEYSYTGPTPIAENINNGNGFGDWFLGDIDLSSYADDATVLFHAVWSGAVDGPESFFLVADGSSPPTGLPEPATLALVGLALMGLGASRRGRKA